MNKKRRFTLLYCLITLLLAAALLLAARHSAGFAEWYAGNIFIFFPNTLGRLFSPLPFSAFELLLVSVGAGLLFFLGYALFMLLRGTAARARLALRLRRLAPRLGVFCCTLLLLYTLTCGVNYSRAPVASALGLTVRPSSTEELRQLYRLLTAEAQELAGQVSTDGEGYFLLPWLIWPPEAEGYGAEREVLPPGQARTAMRQLGAQYGVLDVYYPYPKAVFFSTAMSYLHIAGIYSPFTVEANYNRDMPGTDIPFTICHELAHLSGYAREDEANFLAYLACRESANSDFRYSGLVNALSYVLNALYEAVPAAEYQQLYYELPAQVRHDFRRNAAYWQSFAGRASEISENVNDYYLKANDQADGVKSYGRMVDLLLAYYRGER